MLMRDLDVLRARGVSLYLDSDAFIFGNFDAAITCFEDSGLPLGLIDEGTSIPYRARDCWHQGVPRDRFPRYKAWELKPVLNTGMIFMNSESPVLRELGQAATALYDEFGGKPLSWAEQSVVNALVYERELPIWAIPQHVHFLDDEHLLNHPDPVRPYEIGNPKLNDQAVVYRHFCGLRMKNLYRSFVPKMRIRFGVV
jgi:hypothetical protein